MEGLGLRAGDTTAAFCAFAVAKRGHAGGTGEAGACTALRPDAAVLRRANEVHHCGMNGTTPFLGFSREASNKFRASGVDFRSIGALQFLCLSVALPEPHLAAHCMSVDIWNMVAL